MEIKLCSQKKRLVNMLNYIDITKQKNITCPESSSTRNNDDLGKPWGSKLYRSDPRTEGCKPRGRTLSSPRLPSSSPTDLSSCMLNSTTESAQRTRPRDTVAATNIIQFHNRSIVLENYMLTYRTAVLSGAMSIRWGHAIALRRFKHWSGRYNPVVSVL